jgi:hypothetical protein
MWHSNVLISEMAPARGTIVTSAIVPPQFGHRRGFSDFFIFVSSALT